MKHARSSFSNRLGFVRAAAGSAVGLGNIWRFWHVVGTKVVSDEVEVTGSFHRKKLFEVMIRWIVLVSLAVILAGEILKALGVIFI